STASTSVQPKCRASCRKFCSRDCAEEQGQVSLELSVAVLEAGPLLWGFGSVPGVLDSRIQRVLGNFDSDNNQVQIKALHKTDNFFAGSPSAMILTQA
ncbi:hypothetical protein PspLS_04926, partial [Pyricularia sp. CBS 133598]